MSNTSLSLFNSTFSNNNINESLNKDKLTPWQVTGLAVAPSATQSENNTLFSNYIGLAPRLILNLIHSTNPALSVHSNNMYFLFK